MKNLSVLLYAWTLVLLTVQTAPAQVRFGLKSGLNMAVMSLSDDFVRISEEYIDGNITSGVAPSFHIGGQAEFDFKNNLGLSAGLQLNVKGGTIKSEYDFLGERMSTVNWKWPVYLQVPVALTYRRNGFYAGVGPYVGFGVFGWTVVDDESDSINFGSTSGDNFATLDVGAGLELGYEFKHIRLSASYNRGLTNAVPKDVADAGKDAGIDVKFFHNVFGVSVAYLFFKDN